MIAVQELADDLEPVEVESFTSIWSNWIFFATLYLGLILLLFWTFGDSAFQMSWRFFLGAFALVAASMPVIASAIPGRLPAVVNWTGTLLPLIIGGGLLLWPEPVSIPNLGWFH